MEFKFLLKRYKSICILLFCMLCNSALIAQSSGEITGTVKDANGQPLPGASIIEKGATNGAQTDFDGKFSLNVSNQNATLVISYIGFKAKEVAVNSQTSFNIVLEEDTSSLDEVVVVGYKTIKKSDVSGSISSISAEQISKIKAPSVAQALQGISPGVYVKNNSGQPGGGVSVRVRGIGGLNNSEPLYVIDGIQISVSESENSNPLTSINPNDIQSMEVLKDASTTAIYGSRGANGVVVITTKRGAKDGTSKISFSSSYGTQTVANYGDFHVLNASEFATVVNATQEAAGIAPQFDGSSTLFPTPANLGAGTDHFSAITQVASVQEYQLSASGGNEKTQYYTSLNYLDQEGVVKTTSFDRIRFRLNLDIKVKDNIKLGANISANHGSSNLIGASSRTGEGGILSRSFQYAPTIPIFNADGTYAGPENGFYQPARTPLARLENREGELTSSAVTANIFAELELLKGLSFRTRIVGGISTSKNPLFIPIFEEGNQSDDRSNLTNTVTNGSNYQWSNVLTYNTSFGDHSISALAGIESRESQFNSIFANSRENNNIDRIIGPTGQDDNFLESVTSSSAASYFGNVSYNYKSKYFIDGSIRRDGSSNFGLNNSWGVFPSVSGAWRIGEEDFLKDSFVDELKLRGSYGEVGSDKVAPFQNIVETVIQRYAFGDVVGQALNGRAIDAIGNPDIRWETSKQFNVGIDLELLNHRLTFTAEYFNTDVTDMLLPVAIAATSGTSNNNSELGLRTVDVNSGALTNSGLEFEAAYRGKIGSNGLSYSIGANLTTYNNEVTDISTNEEIFGASFQGQNLSRTIVGGSVGDFYGYVVEGLFQTQAEVDAANSLGDNTIPYQAVDTAPGDFRYKDLNGDNIIDAEDRETIGSPTPDFTYGMNLGLDYKGFDFSMLWYGVQGADIYNANRMDLEASGRTNFNKSRTVLNAWTPDNTNTLIPRRHALDPNNNKRVSSVFVEDGSFLALRNISLGYSLPESLISKLKMSRFRIYVTGQNLLVFTKYTGFDPEVGNIGGGNQGAGIDNDFYPKAKRFDIGINVTF